MTISDDFPTPLIDARRSQKISPDELRHPLVRRGYERWQMLRGSRRYPARADISPRELGSLLKNIALIRVLEGGCNYEFRVVGDAILQIQGILYQGLTTDMLEANRPGYGALLAEFYRKVCETGEPLASCGRIESRQDSLSFHHESLLLPLGPDDRTVDHILVVGVHASS